MFFDEDEDVSEHAGLLRGFNEYVDRYAKHMVKMGNNHDRDVTSFTYW